MEDPVVKKFFENYVNISNLQFGKKIKFQYQENNHKRWSTPLKETSSCTIKD